MENKYNMDDKFDVSKEEKEEIEVLELWEPHADEIKDAKDRHVKWSKQTTNKFVIALVTLGALLLMGYAVFAQPLARNNDQYINGKWEIGFVDMIELNSLGIETHRGSYDFSYTAAEFQISLAPSGDEVIYELTIENKSNFDAIVSGVTVTPEVHEALSYTVSGINEGDRLDAKEKTKMRLSLKSKDLSMKGSIEVVMKVNVNFKQATSEN